MSVDLAISSQRLSEQNLQDLTRDLCKQLNDQGEIQANVPVQPSGPGPKGDMVSLGTLALTFLTSGAAVALFEVAKAYFERDKSLKFVIKNGQGQEFEVTADNLSSSQIDQTIKLANEFAR